MNGKRAAVSLVKNILSNYFFSGEGGLAEKRACLVMEPAISKGLGHEFANIEAKYTMAHLTGTECYSLSGRGYGNTGLCD